MVRAESEMQEAPQTARAEPATIGPFVVLRKLGEGGMGVVFEGMDVQLGRRVALKLIGKQFIDSAEMHARMMREAQAMARLSHANVVHVYQVGLYEDGIYLAMEYIEGQTLTEWLGAATRSWTDILTVVVAAGRGLVAAHAAGMIHRDFKPDNVLVGKDGRVCVADFGLVHTDGPAPAVAATGAANVVVEAGEIAHAATVLVANNEETAARGTSRLTQMGEILGTPVYMSPEQHLGGTVGPASDQFSFGVTLYEALYGTRPFGGGTMGDLKLQVVSGVVPLPPRDSKVPRRVFKILVRSLATTADMRWPTLTQMLEALERDPQRKLLRIAAGVGLAVAVAMGSYATAVARQGAVDRCTGAAQELAGVWDEARAAEAERAFVATGTVYAGDTWQRVRGRLDAYARGWAGERTRACEAHESGAQSTGVFDRRTLCLGHRRAHLEALVEVFVAADRSVLENAVQATAALPSVESCADAEALLAAAAPPEDAVTAAQVESWRGRLARAAALEGTGQYALGLELIAEVKAAAEGLRYAPLTAEVALVEGSLWMATGSNGEAAAALTRALRSGLALGLDGLAAEAAARRLFVIGEGQGRREAALEGEAVAEALAERARDERVTALLHNNLGVVLAAADQAERARGHYLQAIDLLGRGEGPKDPLIGVAHHNLGGLAREQLQLDAAREHYTEAIRRFGELLGEGHPYVTHAVSGLAEVDVLAGRLEAAAAGFTRSLALMEAAYGAGHEYLMFPLIGLGQVRGLEGDHEAATRLFRRAVALGEQTKSVNFLKALVGLAGEVEAADPTEARRLVERAISAAPGEEGSMLAELLVRAGRLAVRTGDVAAARERFERVLAVTTGRKEQVKERGQAALELARLTNETAQACALLAEAKAVDETRVEATALLASRCAGR